MEKLEDKYKITEEALLESGKHLKVIIDGSPIPQFFIDKDHRVVYWNKALEEYTGIKAEEVVGTNQHWRAFYSQERPCIVDLLVDGAFDELPKWYVNYTKSKLVEGAYEATEFFSEIGENGKWLYFTATTIKDSDGEIIGGLETFEDISELIRAEDALYKSEERFRALAHSAVDGIITTDEYGKIIIFNESLQNIFGYSRDELVGESVTLLMPERFRRDFQKSLDRFRETGEHGLAGKTFETTGLRKDGTEFSFEMSLATWEAGGEKFTTSIIRDITKRKEIEKSLSWEVEVNKAIAKLSRKLLSPSSIEDISNLVLKYAKRLTRSRFGFVGYIDPKTGHLVNITWTRDIWEECHVEDKSIVFEKFGGLWGWVLNNKKSILTNDPTEDPRSSGTPKGHIPIQSFLSAPAMIDDALVGQIALANSDTEYSKKDLDLVERLADLYALAINRQRSEEKVRKSEEKYRHIVEKFLKTVTDILSEIGT